MIRKIYVFLLILSFHPFCEGQVIAPQPVNDSICFGQQEASFNLVSGIPDVNFLWETGPSQAGPWAPVNTPDITGIYNDTLRITNAADYTGSWFRCRLYNRFTDNWIEDSNPLKIVIIQPPAPDFGISQMSVQSDCHSLCPDTYVSFIDLTDDDYNITAWLWDFGDGDTSVIPNPNHLFPVLTTQQEYTVNLTTWNMHGCSATTQKTVTVLPEKNLTINGPEIVCSNQASDELSLYYSVSPYDETCEYEWVLPPDEYILETEQIDGGTIRIHWKTIGTAAQIRLGVNEKTTVCDRICVTGEGSKEILLKKKKAPDPAEKIMLKSGNKGILVYLGVDMAQYRWGYTEKTNNIETLITDWNNNFFDFSKTWDTNKYEYWVETSESDCGECWTRSYYIQ